MCVGKGGEGEMVQRKSRDAKNACNIICGFCMGFIVLLKKATSLFLKKKGDGGSNPRLGKLKQCPENVI